MRKTRFSLKRHIALCIEYLNVLMMKILIQDELTGTTLQDLLPLNELLRRKLFDSNVIMNCDLILKSFILVSQANLQDISDLVSLIWSSVVLADPYLKRNDLIILSSCKKFSFFYECLLAIINLLLGTNLTSCIRQFLHNHLEEPLFPIFYDRMNSVFEIFQDNVLSN
ncbi:hypothetical protein MXB_695 [Myxobolus squamalis]|nr:hypothetical protein MXB_695 [Myxobolus squamalis]